MKPDDIIPYAKIVAVGAFNSKKDEKYAIDLQRPFNFAPNS